jgi:TonB family protein
VSSTTANNFGFRKLGSAGFGFMGLLITVGIHGAIVGMAYLSQIASAPRPEATRDMIVTQMIQLGKPREKFWLPRIVQPKPKIEQPVIKVTDNPNAPPAPKEAPKPEDKEISKDLKNALKRAQMLKAAAAEEEAEGSLTGSREGTSSSATEGDEYATLINNAIKRNWNVPSSLLNDAQLAGLEADVRVQIGDDGTLQGARLQKPSGNDLFDDSCVQAVKATGHVPAPPANMKARFKRGVLITFEGKALAH